MMTIKNENRQFANYLLGKLAPEAVTALEEELKNSEEKQYRFEVFRTQQERAAIVMHLKEIRDQEMEATKHLSPKQQIRRASRPSTIRRLTPYLSAAAAALLLLVTAWNFFGSDPIQAGPYATKLAAENFFGFQPITTRGDEEDDWQAANQAYRKEDYQGVIDLLSVRSERTPEMTFLLADAYFKTNNFDNSARLFNQVASNSRSSLRAQARLNASLALLSTKDGFAEGQKQLDDMAEESGFPYKAAAEALRKKLAN